MNAETAKKVEEKGKIKDFITKLIQTNRAVKEKLEPEWNGNLSFYMGDQWVRYVRSLGELTSFKTAYKKYTFNVIRPLVSILTAKLTKAVPVIQVQPNTPASYDMNAARIGQYVAMSEIWEYNQLAIKNLGVMPILTACGSIIAHETYNPRKGKMYSAQDVNAYAGENVWEKDYAEGRLEVEYLTPFEVCNDQDNTEDHKKKWWIISKWRSLAEIKDLWGVSVEGQSGKVFISSTYERFKQSIDKSSAERGAREDGVIVHELWAKAYKVYDKDGNVTEDYPGGRLLIATDNGDVLYDGKLPWGLDECQELPFQQLDYESVLGRSWGLPPITDARPSQKEINKAMSMWIAYVNRCLKMPLMVPEGSGITEDSMVNMLDEIVHYVPNTADSHGGAPHYMQLPSLSPNVMNHVELMRQNIADIFGVHDASQARTGKMSPKSGRGIFGLLEQDDTRIHPLQIRFEHWLSRICSMGLKIIEKTYAIPRLVKIVGMPNQGMIKDFSGDMLGGNHNVKCEIGSALPSNKMAKIDVVNQWWQTGIIEPTPEGRKLLRKMLEFGTYEQYYEGALDEEQARYENSLLDEGKEVNVNPWDNSEIHLKIHEDRQKEVMFLLMAEKDPQLIERYESHKAKHQEALLAGTEKLAAPMPIPGGEAPGGEQIPPELDGMMPGGMPPGGPEMGGGEIPPELMDMLGGGMPPGGGDSGLINGAPGDQLDGSVML